MDTRIFVFLAIVFAICKGCSVFEPNARTANSSEAPEVKVHYSEIVVFGKVGEIVTGNYPFSNISGVSTRSFKVFCIFKGKQDLHSQTNITIVGLGNENKQIMGCPNATVNTDDEVIMFLKSTKQTTLFELEFAPISGATSHILDELSAVCGLEKDPGDKCVDFDPTGECIPYIPSPTKEVASHQQPTSNPALPELETTTQKPITNQTVVEASVKDDKMINNKVESSNNKYMRVSDNKCCSISTISLLMLLCVSALMILLV